MDRNLQQEIQTLIQNNPVVLFMKGTPQMPQCGFSAQTVQLLNALGAPIKGINVLADPQMRDAIKQFSNWPTIPQLYIKGEFVGGCDITIEMYQNGELQRLLENTLGDTLSAKRAKSISPQEANILLQKLSHAKLLDVRSQEEWNTVHLPNSERVDEARANEIIKTVSPETPLFLLCHHGQRSMMACQFFVAHGFSEVYNITGGIEAWAREVDTSLPRY